MSDKEFKNHCAEIVLRTARGKMRSGRVTNISKIGGYNREKFKTAELLKMNAGEFFRFVMNIHFIERNILFRFCIHCIHWSLTCWFTGLSLVYAAKLLVYANNYNSINIGYEILLRISKCHIYHRFNICPIGGDEWSQPLGRKPSLWRKLDCQQVTYKTILEKITWVLK